VSFQAILGRGRLSSARRLDVERIQLPRDLKLALGTNKSAIRNPQSAIDPLGS
jgi:hypothetical protein